MYLIPANAKRGQYIFGLFRPVDLVIFGIGVGMTLLMIMFMPMQETWAAIVAIIPGLIAALLVAPVAYYHNVLQLLLEIYGFFSNRRKYIWKGWCVRDEQQWTTVDRKLD